MKILILLFTMTTCFYSYADTSMDKCIKAHQNKMSESEKFDEAQKSVDAYSQVLYGLNLKLERLDYDSPEYSSVIDKILTTITKIEDSRIDVKFRKSNVKTHDLEMDVYCSR